MTVKVMGAREARNNLSQILGEVHFGGQEFIIERSGKPMVAVISVEEYQRFVAEREAHSLAPNDTLSQSVEKIKQDATDSIHGFLTMDTSRLIAEQRQAYNHTCAIIKQGRRPGEPRILGLFAGLVQIADDFDAPLADEDAFWGQHTDEYGMNLEQ